MKLLAFISVFLVAATVIAQENKSRPPYVPKVFRYDKIVVYKTDPQLGGVFYNNEFHPKAVKDQKELTPPQADSLHALLKQFSPDGKAETKKWAYFYMQMIYYLDDRIVAIFGVSDHTTMIYIYSRTGNSESWAMSKLYFTEQQRKKLDQLCR